MPFSRRMMQHAFDWCGARLIACGSGALWWPERRLLAVADLHLGRSERLARRGGGLLPPYETAATLDRLGEAILRCQPATVICLGDSFDDDACAPALDADARARLAVLMAGRDWIWIAGNHDPAPLTLGGRHLTQAIAGPLTFRHIAQAGAAPGEVSGHWHPKFHRALRGRLISRPCFAYDMQRLILPAFGAYTGGLAVDHPSLRALIGADATVILVGRPCLALPLRPSVTRPSRRTAPA